MVEQVLCVAPGLVAEGAPLAAATEKAQLRFDVDGIDRLLAGHDVQPCGRLDAEAEPRLAVRCRDVKAGVVADVGELDCIEKIERAVVEVRSAEIVGDLLARGKRTLTVAKAALPTHTTDSANRYHQSDDEKPLSLPHEPLHLPDETTLTSNLDPVDGNTASTMDR